MEFAFGEEFVDMVFHLFDVFLQIDLESLDFFTYLLARDGSNLRVEVDFGEIALEDIFYQ